VIESKRNQGERVMAQEYYGILNWEFEDAANNDRFATVFFETPVGQEIKKAGLKTTDNVYAIVGLAQEQAGGRVEITVPEAEAAARELFLAGDLRTKQKKVEEAPASKPLTRSQLAWQEYRIFSESRTSAECKARARVDAGYANFVRKNLEREMNDTPVQDGVEAIGTQAIRRDKTRVTQELREFAEAYRHASTSEVKKLSSPAMNPNGYKEYQENLNAAINAGLI
jgi:hypothetical protein